MPKPLLDCRCFLREGGLTDLETFDQIGVIVNYGVASWDAWLSKQAFVPCAIFHLFPPMSRPNSKRRLAFGLSDTPPLATIQDWSYIYFKSLSSFPPSFYFPSKKGQRNMSIPTLPTRKLGKDDIDVTAIGFGAMGIAAFYGSIDSDEEHMKVRAFFSKRFCADLAVIQFLDELYASGRTSPRHKLSIVCSPSTSSTPTSISCARLVN